MIVEMTGLLTYFVECSSQDASDRINFNILSGDRSSTGYSIQPLAGISKQTSADLIERTTRHKSTHSRLAIPSEHQTTSIHKETKFRCPRLRLEKV
jgi:hypothetical protein